MPEEDITNSLGDTFNEIHNHYAAPAQRKLSPAIAAVGALAGSGVLGGILAAWTLLNGGAETGAVKVDPVEAAASISLYYQRSDGTLVPLDGAETDDGATMHIETEQ